MSITMTPPVADRAMSAPALARFLKVSRDKVNGWINDGQLIAINTGDGSRPRWRILPRDLTTFLEARRRAKAIPARRQRAKKTTIVTSV